MAKKGKSKLPPLPPLPPLRRAAGGVVIDDEGLILLREPTGHHNGYVWTLPKGGIDPGETREEAALREVREETGIEAEIVARIPGAWEGGASLNVYYLMRPLSVAGQFDEETERVAFATYEEAMELIAKTEHRGGRERDSQVVTAAYGLWCRANHRGL